MRIGRFVAVLSVGLFIACSENPTGAAPGETLVYDFQSDAQGWTGGFADYPVGEEEFYELIIDRRSLPAPLDTSRKALFISGNNHSDDLFMFFKRRVDGLEPRTRYRVRFAIDVGTSAGSGCVGIGGPPGEAVYLKAGASTAEPEISVEDGFYRMTFDKGQQAQGSESVLVLGHIGNGSEECIDPPYRIKRFAPRSGAVEAVTGDDGSLWLLVGTDSGFEGTTSLYYPRIEVTLTPR